MVTGGYGGKFRITVIITDLINLQQKQRFYTTSIMTDVFICVIVGSEKKQDCTSGKVRQCCRYIRTFSEIHIARVIFRELLCPKLIKLDGLILHALIWTDQVDI